MLASLTPFAAKIGHRNPGLVLLQNPDDLLFRKTIALHALVLVMGQSELQTGLSPWGKVRAPQSEPDAFKTRFSARDNSGRLYDSRTGLHRLYRYGHRKVAELCHAQSSERVEDRVEIKIPKIHYSVFERIQSGTDSYRPLGLPERYEVVADDGSIIPSTKYETLEQSRIRAEIQERAWDLVWWRRIINLSITTASTFLLLYPIFLYLPTISSEIPPLLFPLFDFLSVIGTLPLSSFWTNAYTRNPYLFVSTVAIIIALCAVGAKLKKRIEDRKRAAWGLASALGLARSTCDRSYLHQGITFRIRTSKLYQLLAKVLRLRIAPLGYAALSAFLSVYLIAATLNRVALLQEDGSGAFCTSTVASRNLRVGERVEVEFPIHQLCYSTGLVLEEDALYRFTFEEANPWSDGDIPTSMGGYRLADIPTARRPVILLAQLFKRNLSQPFFRVIMRIGVQTNNEQFVGDDLTSSPESNAGRSFFFQTLRAKRTGELFLYVNDVIISIPGYVDRFYRNNRGSAVVTVERRQ